MSSPVSQSLRILLTAYGSSACWAFTFGLGAPLASLWLRDCGYGDTAIGLNTGAHYFGIVAMSLFVPPLLRRGGRNCIVWGMLASGLTFAIFPFAHSLAIWILLRFLDGVAGALSVVPTETLVNRFSPPEQRARNFGIYALSVAFGLAAGNFAGLQLYADHPYGAFLLAGAAGIVAAACVYFGVPSSASPPEEEADAVPLHAGQNLLGFGSAWCQGFVEGSLIAFLSLYLLFLGMTEAHVSWMTTAIMVGVIAVQVPLAWLADRFGRVAIILGCYLATAVGFGCLPFCRSEWSLTAWLFLAGAASSALYPLGLALLGERIPEAGMARANAWYLLSNCLGSLSGPVVAGVAMDYLGKPALFWSGLGAVLVVLTPVAVLNRPQFRGVRTSKRSAVPPTAGNQRKVA